MTQQAMPEKQKLVTKQKIIKLKANDKIKKKKLLLTP